MLLGVILVLGITLIVLGGYMLSAFDNPNSYRRGFRDGVSRALDTVKILLDKRVNDTSSAVTALVIEDTFVYYLSKKTITPR